MKVYAGSLILKHEEGADSHSIFIPTTFVKKVTFVRL